MTTQEPTYEPQVFWHELLTRSFDCVGVGHGGYGSRYNSYLYRAKREAVGRSLAALQIDLPRARILDVGSGIGYWLAYYQCSGANTVVGCDIAPISVERLRKRFPAYTLKHADISSPGTAAALATAGEGFDLITAFDVLYHVLDEGDFDRAIVNLVSLCRPGGIILLTDTLGPHDVEPVVFKGGIRHVRFRSAARYQSALAMAPQATVERAWPLYALLNRPMVGDTFPWTNRRLSWHIRYRLSESRPVAAALFWVDQLLVRFLPLLRLPTDNLKLVALRRSP